ADFPDRSRTNPFVARLWATQRVGFLAAERRVHGGSPEVDDEIRQLGERYGIPTEFTSYLVTEPALATNLGMAGGLRRGVMTDNAPAPAAAQRDMRFEVAKAASVQRVAVTAAVLDSMAVASTANAMAGGRQNGAAVTTRRVDGRTFVLRDSVWTDSRYQP